MGRFPCCSRRSGLCSEIPPVRTRSLALVLTAIVGFTATGVASAHEGTHEQDEHPAPTKTLRTLRDYPKPPVTGPQLAAGVEAFSSAYPLRLTGSLSQTDATEELRTELASLGYAVQVTTYRGVLQAVIATKKGTVKPAEHIVFGGHFDTMVGTVTGHYDNGSGTRMVVEIAWPLGSKATATNAFLCLWRGARDEDFDTMLAEVNYGFLKLPAGKNKVSIEGRNVRNSDEASWADAGFRTLRWAGLRTAGTYPQYHLPQDNMATIDTVAGGHAFFEAGLRNTLLSAYYTAAGLDLQK